jgi:class 3 adenylate cyclase
MNTQIDIRNVLPAIRVPTLVMHRTGDLDCDVGGGRYLANQIPGAKYVELPGQDHLPWVGDQDAILDEVERFLSGIIHPPELDRVLATVMFTQIDGPSDPLARESKEQWQDVIERHHAVVRREIERFRGREIDATENEYIATFDGPARAIRTALAIRDSARRLGIAARTGLHTGECDVIGEKLGGNTLEIGADVAAQAWTGEVLVSSTVKDLVAGSGIEFIERGVHALKGELGEWHLFAVDDGA